MNRTYVMHLTLAKRNFSHHQNASNSSTDSSIKPIVNSLWLQVVFSVIAALSILLNAVVCIVLARKRTMLQKAHNVLILNLAVTDALTGFVICLTPGMILKESGQLPLQEGVGAVLFCRLIHSRFLLYTFGKASLLTVLCLAVERWVSMVKPLYFRTSFSKRRVLVYLGMVWLISVVIHVNHILQRKSDGSKCLRRHLFGKYSDTASSKWFTVVYVIITFNLPLIVTWFVFAHIWYVLNRTTTVETRSIATAKRRLLNMCAVNAFLLTVCWLPSETSLIVGRFLDAKPDYLTNNIVIALSMANSCTNPLVYYFTNLEYKREMKRLLFCNKENIPLSTRSITLQDTDHEYDTKL